MSDNRIVLVTGSSRGIGEALVRGFAQKGCGVIINCRTSTDEAEALMGDMIAKGEVLPEKIMIVPCDIASRDEVVRMFDAVEEHFGTPPDVLINNAGLNVDRPFLELTQQEWQRVCDINLTGTFNVSQEFAKRYKGKNGHIVSISAATAIHGRANGANYCASKAGVVTLDKCMAIELAPNISVNTVHPGYINTREVIERYELEKPDKLRSLLDKIPQNRLGRVEDVFGTIDFIVSGASFVTGQNFFVNGGNYMH